MERQRKLLMEKQPSLYSPEEFSMKRQNSSPRSPVLDSRKVRDSPADVKYSKAPSEEPVRAPIISSRDWIFQELLEKGPHFKKVHRISALMPAEDLLRAIDAYEASDKPLIIEGWHEHPAWPKDLFDIDKLVEKCGAQTWSVRNVRDYSDRDVTLAEFIAWSRRSANDMSRSADELLYGKDAPCPPEWKEWVDGGKVLPPVLCPKGPGDLFQHLDKSEDVESLMCYFGIGDTFTPCHKDLCASSGHNIMCYTENGGSSFWFMTASSDAPAVGAYFQKDIGQELDWEAHTATVDEFAQAPFTVYVAEQKLGDLVLVPPRSCHQVVNHGGLTVKTSWSRMTVQGLSIALYHELPIYRRVCRSEQYRVKQILYCSLMKYSAQLKQLPPLHSSTSATQEKSRIKVASDLAKLVDLFDFVMEGEFTTDHKDLATIVIPQSIQDPTEVKFLQNYRRSQRNVPPPNASGSSPVKAPSSNNFACDFCGADIFQSFFECSNSCRSEETLDDLITDEVSAGDGLLICPSCYIEGRTCACQEMRPLQCRPLVHLLEERNQAAYLLTTRVSDQQNQRLQISEQELPTRDINLRVFEAGCRLAKLRQQPNSKTRKCRDCGHTGLASAEVYHCTDCHGSKCVRHLLDCGIHSAEAILKFTPKCPQWHKFHQRKAAGFKSSISTFDEAERKGDVISYRDRLVLVARRYKSCRSLNPRSTHPGWYDVPFEPTRCPKTSRKASKPDTHSCQGVHSHADGGTTNASCLPKIRIAARERMEDSDYHRYKAQLPSHSASPLSSLTPSPSPLTICLPARPPRVPETRGKIKRRYMLAEVVISTRPPLKSTAPSSGTMAKRQPNRLPTFNRHEDNYASEFVKVINNANQGESSASPSGVHVRHGRVESPPESPTLSPSTLSSVEDSSPPRKRQKIANNPVAPSSPTQRRATCISQHPSKQAADIALDSVRKARSNLSSAARYGPPKPHKGPTKGPAAASQRAVATDHADGSRSLVARKPRPERQPRDVEMEAEAVPTTTAAAVPAASATSTSAPPNQPGASVQSHISSSTQLTVHSFPPSLQMSAEGLPELIRQVAIGLPDVYTRLGGLERVQDERSSEIKALRVEVVGLRDEVREMRILKDEVKQLRVLQEEVARTAVIKEEFQAFKAQAFEQIKALQATIEKLNKDSSNPPPRQDPQPPVLPQPPSMVPPPSLMQPVPPHQLPPQQLTYPAPPQYPFPQNGIQPNAQFGGPPPQFWPNFGHNSHHNGPPTNYRGRGRPNYRYQNNRPWQNNNQPYDRQQQNDRQSNDDDYYHRVNHTRDDYDERQPARRNDSSARQDRESRHREDSRPRHNERERDPPTRSSRDEPSRQRDEPRHANEHHIQHDIRRGRPRSRSTERHEEYANELTPARSVSRSRSRSPSPRARSRSPSEVPSPRRRSPSSGTAISFGEPDPEPFSSRHRQHSPDFPSLSPDNQ